MKIYEAHDFLGRACTMANGDIINLSPREFEALIKCGNVVAWTLAPSGEYRCYWIDEDGARWRIRVASDRRIPTLASAFDLMGAA